MFMEPISEVLSGVVAELIEMERGADRMTRVVDLEEAAAQAALPGFSTPWIWSGERSAGSLILP
jgi:hypothetical protein